MSTRKRHVASTRGTDPGKSFYGGPLHGDLGNVGIVLPRAPTTTQHNRYLCRLAAMQVDQGYNAVVTSIRQLLTIATKIPILTESRPVGGGVPVGGEGDGEGDDPCEMSPATLLERQVKTPIWSFPDGNVVWFLRAVPSHRKRGTAPAGYADGYDRNIYGLDPALISLTVPPAAYNPPNNGQPLGDAVSEYGIWYDMRFPWYTHTSNQQALALRVPGPCTLTLYASVWQTDPATRPRPAIGPGPEQFTTEAGLEEEDKFWIAFPCTRYYRIGGEITAEYERRRT